MVKWYWKLVARQLNSLGVDKLYKCIPSGTETCLAGKSQHGKSSTQMEVHHVPLPSLIPRWVHRDYGHLETIQFKGYSIFGGRLVQKAPTEMVTEWPHQIIEMRQKLVPRWKNKSVKQLRFPVWKITLIIPYPIPLYWLVNIVSRHKVCDQNPN